MLPLRAVTAEPTAHPGSAPAQGTWPQEEDAAGSREEGAEAGDLLGEALCPAHTAPGAPGLVRMLSPCARGVLGPGTMAAGGWFGNLGHIQC